MRVGFAGTPAFAQQALQAIHQAGYSIPVVLTQPDRPHGRGLRAGSSPVKQWAQAHDVPVLQPPGLKVAEHRAAALAIPLDVLVVAAYGLIFPADMLAWPRYGCLNIHASRLPRWRGAAPIQRAVAAGDRSTGITIMQMDAGLDTGPVIEQRDVVIDPRETAGTLHDKLAAVGADAIVDVLARLARDGALHSTPQTNEGTTYAAKIEPHDALIDWRQPALEVDRQIRALDPVPGASTLWDGGSVKVWSALPLPRDQDAEPGTVLAIGARGIDIACGNDIPDGALRLVEVQPGSGKRMPAAAFLAGRRVVPGMRFGAASGSF